MVHQKDLNFQIILMKQMVKFQDTVRNRVNCVSWRNYLGAILNWFSKMPSPNLALIGAILPEITESNVTVVFELATTFKSKCISRQRRIHRFYIIIWWYCRSITGMLTLRHLFSVQSAFHENYEQFCSFLDEPLHAFDSKRAFGLF